jgi:hypothetical protein
MATKTEILLELERRDALPQDKVPVIAELRKRNAFPAPLIKLPVPGQPLQLPELGQRIPVEFAGPTVEKIGRSTLEMGASAAGGAFGLATGGPLGAIAGGGLAGGAGRELGDIIFGEDIGSVQEELAEAGFNVLDMAALEAAGMAGGQILTRTGKEIFKSGKLAARGARVTAKQIGRILEAQKLRIPLTVGELMDKPFIKGIENLVRKVITPTGRVKAFDDRRIRRFITEFNDMVRGLTGKKPTPKDEAGLEALMSKIAREIDLLMAGKIQAKGQIAQKLKQRVANKFGLTEDFISTGERAIEVLGKRRKQFRNASSALINKGKDLAPQKGQSIIKTTGAIAKVDKAIARARLGLKTAAKSTIQTLESIKEDFIKNFPEEAPSGLVDSLGRPIIKPKKAPLQEITLDEFLAKRSDMNDILAGTRQVVSTQTGEQVVVSDAKTLALIKSIKDEFDRELQRFAKDTGNEVVAGFINSGIDVSRRGFEFTDIPSVKKLLKAKPEDVARILIRSGRNATVQLFSELNPAQRIPFKKAVVGDVLGVDKDVVTTGTDIVKNINNIGEGTLRTFIGDESTDDLLNLGRKLTALQKGVVRRQVATTATGGVSLGPIALAGNKHFRTLVTSKRPRDLVNIVYQKETSKGIKRTYDVLNKAGRPDLIQDLKVALLDDTFRFGTLDQPTVNTGAIVKRVNDRGLEAYKNGLTKKEFEAFSTMFEAIKTVNLDPNANTGKIIRVLGEILGFPASLVLFRDRTVPLLNKAIKLANQELTLPIRKQLNSTLIKLIGIGAEANHRQRLREIERSKTRPEMQPLELKEQQFQSSPLQDTVPEQ